MGTIADHVSVCLQEFSSLCNSPAIWTDSALGEGPQSDVSLLKLQNELSRFKVWSGNIGAHKKGRSSLDHRLRDASNIRNQVVELLEDLKESLNDAKDILTGQTTPWDQEQSLAEYSEDDSDNESFKVDASRSSEISQIFAAIVEDINCLLRLSVSIHNPSPHDRFKKACLTDTSGYEPFDVQHVCNKLSKAPKPITERLGKAISRRRQYFKYRELHHDKLASGLELDDKDQIQSTVASSLPKKLNVNEPISLVVDGDDVSDNGRSQTSWATSAVNPDRRKIPALPAEAENGPFECPFCFMMVSITSRIHWKKHVFSDLFPYICVELGCPAPDQDFQRRHQWAGHVKKYHWKTWTCKLGCNEAFLSVQDMERHLAQEHSETAESTHLASLLSMCGSPKSEDEPADCPLCGERQSSFKQYQRHVGRHQEDLALFALPHLPSEDDKKNDEPDFESVVQDDMGPEIRDELEKGTSHATSLSDKSRDEATDASDRSIRYARGQVFDAVDYTAELPGLFPPWNCPVLTCEYHSYRWSTEEERDRHYRDKHSKTPAIYKCMFELCPYKSNRETNCMHHMEEDHGWTYTYTPPEKGDWAAIFDTGVDTTIEQPRKPLDTASAEKLFAHERGKDLIMPRHIETMAPIKNRESFDIATVDVLHLKHKQSSYTWKFPRHDIRDGKLRVSQVRELAADMTDVPESFRHLVELSCKGTKLLIDGTPIRNYGVSNGDTIEVKAPQFRNFGQFDGLANDDPLLDNGHGTGGNMGFEWKAERDERRAEFPSESQQRAMVEAYSYYLNGPKRSNPRDVREDTDLGRNNIRKRTKTGCLTCRRRRLKCDEGRPVCNNCIKSKRRCEGYSQTVSFGGSTSAIQGVPVPESEPDLEVLDTREVSGPIPPSEDADSKVKRAPKPGVRCPTCAFENKEVWVLPGRTCGYCGTPCA